MHDVQEIRNIIISLLKKKGISANKMLNDCGYTTSLVSDMKKGQMPAADKIATIAVYLDVSTDYLMGITKDPTPANKTLSIDEQIAAEYYNLSAEEREHLKYYLEFLKTEKIRRAKSKNMSTEISSELQPEY